MTKAYSGPFDLEQLLLDIVNATAVHARVVLAPGKAYLLAISRKDATAMATSFHRMGRKIFVQKYVQSDSGSTEIVFGCSPFDIHKEAVNVPELIKI